ncbi:nitrogenase-stabilizing/protective protein NifW [Pantoea sp. At-9b]|uniref:nitrogenase-stabilizing/protective protein NifW n=1 Tax=Pantoea sp. (strain At-9b) TaxID=592316 RepID=UPI0001B400B1|nr:nitrogenase-stabilizing/protective protein NifW [Pantoea sp. At-9b]ACU32743.1 nitrogen fixation protein [Pantoea sp. At-9b]ADU72678.1 putative NifW protein [Pantoea sp. At-9b]
MQWFYQIPGVDTLDTAESFFVFFAVDYDATLLKPCCLPVLREFHRKIRDNVPLQNHLEDEPRAPWLLARRLLTESYQHYTQGGQP